MITRQQFLKGAAAGLGLLGLRPLAATAGAAPVPGRLVGANAPLGHRLRTGGFPAPSRTFTTDVVIIGAGIAGLGAGYRLHRNGFEDFLLLDLDTGPGGNAANGRNGVCAYPWGAHYVPLLTAEARAVHELFEDLGIITGHDAAGLPIYDEFALCSDPQERLYRYGRWQDGLIPTVGITAQDEADYKRFFAAMEAFRQRKDAAGRRAFAIPLDLSSQDEDLLALDTLTMAAWMDREGYASKELRWYINYCCRDDFGTRYEETSAWAGIHYFASRNGRAANAEPQSLVTWPEGNGYLAQRLAAPLAERVRTRMLAYRVAPDGDKVVIEAWDENARQSQRIEARAVLMATPHFVSARLLGGSTTSTPGLSYAPWAIANITLDRLPVDRGVGLSWDNVAYDSPLLGYVNAAQQITQMHPLQTVLTYYWPMSEEEPAQARRKALDRTLEEWQSIFLGELFEIHPDLEGHVTSADIRVWGHAMVRPTPGFIWGAERRAMLLQSPPLFTAHSDMSGISLFEEAYTHGVRAAEAIMTYRGHSFRSVL